MKCFFKDHNFFIGKALTLSGFQHGKSAAQKRGMSVRLYYKLILELWKHPQESGDAFVQFVV